MTSEPSLAEESEAQASRFSDLLELTKPRITFMVVLTAGIGALLASRGWTAAQDVFGPQGYFDTFLGDEQEPELLLKDFADPFWMVSRGVGFKQYPSNYFTHRPIDAALAIRARSEFDVADIESVTIRFPDLRYVDRPEPVSGLDGKFSLQYTTAVALLDGDVTIDSFTVSLLVAVLLQVLLKLTLTLEHRVAEYFNARTGPTARALRYFSAWLILFGSKFVMLGPLIWCSVTASYFLDPCTALSHSSWW